MITPPTIFTLKITQRLLFSCMKQLRIFLLLALWTGTIGLTGTLYGQSEIAEIMRNRSIDWQQPQARAQAVEEMRAIEVRELNKARQIAQQRGKPLREKLPNGKVRELVGLDEDGDLLYVETKNVNAAISAGAKHLHQAPYSLNGSGLTVGVWDAPDSDWVPHREFKEGAASRGTAMTIIQTFRAGVIIQHFLLFLHANSPLANTHAAQRRPLSCRTSRPPAGCGGGAGSGRVCCRWIHRLRQP